MVKTSKTQVVSGLKKHKILSVVALAGLFVCGLGVGYGLGIKKDIEPKIHKELKTCEKIENELLKRLIKDQEKPEDYNHNMLVYADLITYACPENRQNYYTLTSEENIMVRALYPEYDFEIKKSLSSCEKAENIILGKIYADTLDRPEAYQYINDAENYIRLVKTGCPKNREMYKGKAVRALEIATSITDTNDEGSQKYIVRLYKELEGVNAAAHAIEVIKGITYPTIEFVLELERIANEHQ